jgi:hypothetical protein
VCAAPAVAFPAGVSVWAAGVLLPHAANSKQPAVANAAAAIVVRRRSVMAISFV